MRITMLTKEMILREEHNVLMIMNPWDFDTADEKADAAIWQSGVIDMTNALIRLLEQSDVKNGGNANV